MARPRPVPSVAQVPEHGVLSTSTWVLPASPLPGSKVALPLAVGISAVAGLIVLGILNR